MELKKTKRFSSICIILSALAVLSTAVLVILLNLGIGYTVTEGDGGEQAAQVVVGVIFVALSLIVLCGVAVFSALTGGIVLILASKGKQLKALLITSAVIKFLSALSLAVLGFLIVTLDFWLVGIAAFIYVICFTMLGIFDILSSKEGKMSNR